MNIGFLRSTASIEELGQEMTALENVGCERIILESSVSTNPAGGMLAAVIGRLKDGDALIVWSLDSVANSMAELVDVALRLESGNIRLRSLKEGFDSRGRHRAALKAILHQFAEFEEQLELRHHLEASANQTRRVGRPRSLSPEDIERAHKLLNEGKAMDDVAGELHVSRATLYRYLDEGKSGPRGGS